MPSETSCRDFISDEQTYTQWNRRLKGIRLQLSFEAIISQLFDKNEHTEFNYFVKKEANMLREDLFCSCWDTGGFQRSLFDSMGEGNNGRVPKMISFTNLFTI